MVRLKLPFKAYIKSNKSFIYFVGRASTNDISFSETVNARTISREHSKVIFEDGRIYIENLSKTNCTFVNDDKVNRNYWKLPEITLIWVYQKIILNLFICC